jgi:leucine dehydrogenase
MMNILEQMTAHDHEQVIAFQNNAVGLRGFLAIHDTTCGPALGGVRIWKYSSEDEALADALRLSRGMTYKAAISELPCGGGKCVILLRDDLKRAEAFEAYGQLVESLHGRFFTGRDVGITDEDLQAIARTTKYVAKEPDPALGDVSEHTAIGVWHGMRACLEFAELLHSAKKTRVAIQGVGSVGMILARLLRREGMELVVADVDGVRAREAAKELGAKVVAPEEVLSTECDVLAPCALGGVMSLETIPRVKARVVCGCANNVLVTPEAGDELARRGILYAPDYLVNAGGLIRGAEFFLMGRTDSRASLERIHDRMLQVLERARERGASTARISDEMAESRLQKSKTFRHLYWGGTASRSFSFPVHWRGARGWLPWISLVNTVLGVARR